MLDLAIADVTVRKHHQRLDEIMIIFCSHYTRNQHSCLQESSVSNARIYNKRMLYETQCELDCVKFRGRIA